MTQIQMEYFIKTCELGNIAQAADVLFVSRSAVSRAISDLEKEFRAQLLTRSNNGVVPTDAGQIVLEMAKNVSSSYQGVMNRIRALEEAALYRRIRVGITPTNSLQVYQNYLRQYALDNPGVELVLTEACASRCLELLSQGQVDVTFVPSGIIREQPNTVFFQTLPLYRNRIVLWVRKDSPLAEKESLEIHDILDCPLGYLNAPMPMEKSLESCFEAYGKQPRLTIRTTSVPLLRQMVLDGQTCALIPDDMFEPSPELAAVPMRFFRVCTNYLLWDRSSASSGAVGQFISRMVEKAAYL